MRYLLNSNIYYLNRALSSETHKRLLVVGFLLKLTMIRIRIPASLETGLRRPRILTQLHKVSAVKVFGETRTAFATGERSESKNIFLKVRDSKVSGKTLKKSAAYSEYSCYLMKKILGNLLRDSRKHTRQEPTQTP